MPLRTSLPNLTAEEAAQIPLRYRFDLEALVTGLLPHLLRRPVLRAYLVALLTPLADSYGRFVSFTARTRRELSYNGQTLSFQRALNDLFDPVLARIRLINSDASIESVYINFVAEGEEPRYTKFAAEAPPHFVLYSQEEVANQTGFVVRCPASLRPREAALRARISQLKLAMVKYRIQYV